MTGEVWHSVAVAETWKATESMGSTFTTVLAGQTGPAGGGETTYFVDAYGMPCVLVGEGEEAVPVPTTPEAATHVSLDGQNVMEWEVDGVVALVALEHVAVQGLEPTLFRRTAEGPNVPASPTLRQGDRVLVSLASTQVADPTATGAPFPFAGASFTLQAIPPGYAEEFNAVGVLVANSPLQVTFAIAGLVEVAVTGRIAALEARILELETS